LQNLKGRDHLEKVGIDGRILLEWSLGNKVGRCGLDVCGLKIGMSGSLL
jgi:hypothetical protein